MPDEPISEPGGDPGTPASGSPPAAPQSPGRRRKALIAVIAGAVLAAAAASAIALGSPSQGPRYARPRNVCDLVTAATLTKYVPGLDDIPGSPNAVGRPAPGNCDWITANAILSVFVVVYSSSSDGATSARQFFNGRVQELGKGGTGSGLRMTTTGKRPVAGLGDQATALLQTMTVLTGGKDRDWADLFVRSGNAEIEINYSVSIPSAAQLPAAIAVARDVLAALPRS
jgi:hypothetical protein